MSLVLKSNYQVKMLSHASNEQNTITLYYDVINDILPSDDVTNPLVLSCVVSKLSVLCLLWI